MRSLLVSLLLASGCASAPAAPPGPPRLYEDGVRQLPLTEDEVEARVRALAPRLENCYREERLNLSAELSEYLFEIVVPADGQPVEVDVVEESVPEQVSLHDCMLRIFSSMKFTAHVGEPITLRVPVRSRR